MTRRAVSVTNAYLLAAPGVVILAFYAIMQTVISTAVSQHNSALKVLFEPVLLLLGVVLHVHWRKVDRIFKAFRLRRPLWITAADALSFVITFWALATLLSVFWN